jgi:cellulose synthase/poly-beta-1,6-N-acetylglucosamine synthase-like glycosyltransferase
MSGGGRTFGPSGPDAREPGATVTLTRRLLAVLGVPPVALAAAIAAADARDDGEDAATLLIADGHLDADRWWPALADALGLAYRDAVAPWPDPLGGVPGAAVDRALQQIWIEGGDGPMLALAPRGVAVARIAGFLAEHPELRRRVVVVRPETLRTALRQQSAVAMTAAAVGGLARSRPLLSAATPPAPTGVRLLTLVLALLPFAIALVGTGVGVALLALFLPQGLLRLGAAVEPARSPPADPPADSPVDSPFDPAAPLPTYALLVPLYHEAAMVPALADAIGRLDYPRDRLDVKILVEDDDAPTAAAAETAVPRAGWEVVRVPPSRPRTKPKALAYGLQLVDADLVAVFDAEDRPDPDQLRRAAAAFAVAPADVACIQASLAIDHLPASHNWLAAQFGLEYRIQFETIMPWLARRGGWFPLGGTSNHFRRAALAEVGGWDPYNVTEDADISIRLARGGWRLDVLASRTAEEAPMTRAVWLAQRSRWLKGWMQTWAVHMRRPVRLLRQLGAGRFLLMQLMLAGQVVSAFVFPASLVTVVMLATGLRPFLAERSFVDDLGMAAAVATLALAWGATGVLAFRTAPPGRRLATLLLVATLPVYWLLLYPAALRAARELAARPFAWNKTPHGRAARRSDAVGGSS